MPEHLLLVAGLNIAMCAAANGADWIDLRIVDKELVNAVFVDARGLLLVNSRLIQNTPNQRRSLVKLMVFYLLYLL